MLPPPAADPPPVLAPLLAAPPLTPAHQPPHPLLWELPPEGSTPAPPPTGLSSTAMSTGVALSTAHVLNAARDTGGVQRHTRRCVPYLLLWSLTALVVTPCVADAVRGVALYALRPIAITLAFASIDPSWGRELRGREPRDSRAPCYCAESPFFLFLGRKQCANGVSKPVWLAGTDLIADSSPRRSIRRRSYGTASFFSDRPGTSYGLLWISMYILFVYCHRLARLCGALLGTFPCPHPQCPATSRCGGVSVCFLCGSLCGLLLAALCGPLCGGPLLCGPLCGSSRRLLLAAFYSAFLRHSFSVICLSFAASAVVLSHRKQQRCTVAVVVFGG